MDEWSTLAAQVGNVTEDLRRAKAATARLRDCSDDAQIRVGGRLEDEIARLERRRNALTHAVTRRRGGELGSLWADLRVVRRDVDAACAECLAITQGAWAREAGLDAGLCSLADSLVRHLVKAARGSWDLMTVPSSSEFYGYLASVIRVRYPASGIWSLPIAAHEFGHFVTPKLELQEVSGAVRRERYPFQALLDAKVEQSRAWSLLHELIADAFATYTLGLAYPCTCVVLRFNPGAQPYTDGARHPADAKRVLLMLRVLEKLDASRVAGVRFGRRAERLRDIWERSLAGAQQPQELEADQHAETLATADELAGLLFECVPGAAYAGLARAQEFARWLRQDGAGAMPRRRVDITDVLNAAWLARIDGWDDSQDRTQAIGERAAQMLQDDTVMAA